MLPGWGMFRRAGVIVVDDDPAWHRSMRRVLRELDVRRVYGASARDDLEALMVELDPCVVLSDLELGADRLAGLAVLDAAYAFGAPAALVAGCPVTRLEPLLQPLFLRKTHVNGAALHALLRQLEVGLPSHAQLLPRGPDAPRGR